MDKTYIHRNLITLEAACAFLDVSKPTFNQLREDLKINAIQGPRRRIFFDKFELITKVTAKQPSKLELVDLVFMEKSSEIKSIKLDENVFDLRAVNLIDPYGALSLLSAVRALVEKNIIVNLIIDDKFACDYLNGIGLFNELDRAFKDKVKWDRNIQAKLLKTLPEVLYLSNLITFGTPLVSKIV